MTVYALISKHIKGREKRIEAKHKQLKHFSNFEKETYNFLGGNLLLFDQVPLLQAQNI